MSQEGGWRSEHPRAAEWPKVPWPQWVRFGFRIGLGYGFAGHLMEAQKQQQQQ